MTVGTDDVRTNVVASALLARAAIGWADCRNHYALSVTSRCDAFAFRGVFGFYACTTLGYAIVDFGVDSIDDTIGYVSQFPLVEMTMVVGISC